MKKNHGHVLIKQIVQIHLIVPLKNMIHMPQKVTIISLQNMFTSLCIKNCFYFFVKQLIFTGMIYQVSKIQLSLNTTYGFLNGL